MACAELRHFAPWGYCEVYPDATGRASAYAFIKTAADCALLPEPQQAISSRFKKSDGGYAIDGGPFDYFYLKLSGICTGDWII